MGLELVKQCCASAGADGMYAAGEASSQSPLLPLYDLFRDAGRVPRIRWDHFHRVNKAGVNAMKINDAAVRFFDLLHDLQCVFGIGQGRALHLQVQVESGVTPTAHTFSGGTRQFNYLTEAPKRFVQKWRQWLVTAEIRKRHREEDGRGTRNLEWWSQLCTRLTDVGIIVFSMIFDAALRAVSPYSLLVQKCDVLASSKLRAREHMYYRLDQVKQGVKRMTYWVAVLPFIAPYVLLKDLDVWLWTLAVHSWGKVLPLLASHVVEIAVHGHFQHEDVLFHRYNIPKPTENLVEVHGSCQCGSRRKNQNQRIRVKVKFGGHEIKVPRWVGFDKHLRMSTAQSKPTSCVRKMVRARMAFPPTRRCVVSQKTQTAVGIITAAGDEALDFLESLRTAIEDYEGDRGVTRELSTLDSFFSHCFAPETLVTVATAAETAHQRQSLLDLYAILLPELQHTLWPSWQEVNRQWPSPEEMSNQHCAFRKVIRERAVVELAKLRDGKHSDWYKTVYCEVFDINRFCRVCGSVSRSWEKVQNFSKEIFIHICSFEPNLGFRCSPGSLGPRWPRAKQSPHLILKEHKLYRLQTAQVNISCVLLLRLHGQLVSENVAKSIEHDAETFPKHLWHVMRFFHRARMTSADSEAPAESFIGIFSDLWDKKAGLATKRIVDRALIRSWGFLAREADEGIVDAVCRSFSGSPYYKSKFYRKRRCHTADERHKLESEIVRKRLENDQSRNTFDPLLRVPAAAAGISSWRPKPKPISFWYRLAVNSRKVFEHMRLHTRDKAIINKRRGQQFLRTMAVTKRKRRGLMHLAVHDLQRMAEA